MKNSTSKLLTGEVMPDRLVTDPALLSFSDHQREVEIKQESKLMQSAFTVGDMVQAHQHCEQMATLIKGWSANQIGRMQGRFMG